MVVPLSIPVPVILSDTITRTASTAVRVSAVDPLVIVVAVIWKLVRPMYRSSLYSANEDTAPKLRKVLFTVTLLEEVIVWVPVPAPVTETSVPPSVKETVMYVEAIVLT